MRARFRNAKGKWGKVHQIWAISPTMDWNHAVCGKSASAGETQKTEAAVDCGRCLPKKKKVITHD